MSVFRLTLDGKEIAAVVTGDSPVAAQQYAMLIQEANRRAIEAQNAPANRDGRDMFVSPEEVRAANANRLYDTEADVLGHYPPLAIESPAVRECSTTNERISAGRDKRGYEFYCYRVPDVNLTVIRAGCRTWASFRDAQAHYGVEYASDGDVNECRNRLNLLENLAIAAGWNTRPQVATQVHEAGTASQVTRYNY